MAEPRFAAGGSPLPLSGPRGRRELRRCQCRIARWPWTGQSAASRPTPARCLQARLAPVAACAPPPLRLVGRCRGSCGPRDACDGRPWPGRGLPLEGRRCRCVVRGHVVPVAPGLHGPWAARAPRFRSQGTRRRWGDAPGPQAMGPQAMGPVNRADAGPFQRLQPACSPPGQPTVPGPHSPARRHPLLAPVPGGQQNLRPCLPERWRSRLRRHRAPQQTASPGQAAAARPPASPRRHPAPHRLGRRSGPSQPDIGVERPTNGDPPLRRRPQARLVKPLRGC